MHSLSVNLSQCTAYKPPEVYEQIDRHLTALGCSSYHGKTVFLKPNLITARAPLFACTNGVFLIESARWFVDHGGRVFVGDSPAYGNASGVLRHIGAVKELAALGVVVDDFTRTRSIILSDGTRMKVGAIAYECDQLVNIPKIKAHNQMYVTLAMKNLFGLVKGYKKAILHISHGQTRAVFSRMILELIDSLPFFLTLADGIDMMHKAGPIKGEVLSYGLIASGINPVALDCALMETLGLDHSLNPLLHLASEQKRPGTERSSLHYPMLRPGDFTAARFEPPSSMKPISFHPAKVMVSGIKRLIMSVNDHP